MMFFKVILFSFVFLPAASAASQYYLDICNTGDDDFYLATAEKPFYSFGSFNVGGWAVIEPGECWNRTANGAYHVDIHINHADPNGKVGTPNAESLAVATEHSAVDIGRESYCVDLFSSFSRNEEVGSTKSCPPGWVRTKFPISVQGTPSNAKVNVAVDTSVAHAPEDVYFDLVKEEPVEQSSDKPVTNASLVADIRRLAILSDRLTPPKKNKMGDWEFQRLQLLIGDMFVATTFHRDIETKKIVRCDTTHRYKKGEITLYADTGCDGRSEKISTKIKIGVVIKRYPKMNTDLS